MMNSARARSIGAGGASAVTADARQTGAPAEPAGRSQIGTVALPGLGGSAR